MQKVNGDLVTLAKDGFFDVIVHGCNCMHTMGRGVALAVRNAFPQAYEADKATAYGDRAKLGTLSVAKLERETGHLWVVNAYTQHDWRGVGVKVDYDAVRRCFSQIRKDFAGLRIGYPLIGAGLAGGDWVVLERIIEQELQGQDHTLVVWEGSK